MSKYRSLGIAGILVGALLFGCSQNPLTTDSDDQTNYSIDVKGKVLDKDNNPLVGATAKLLNLNLTATTNDKGEYRITGNKTLPKRSTGLGKVLAEPVLDTLVIEKSGSEIQRIALSSLVSKLPTTYIIQREIRGTIYNDNGEIGKIIATVADKQYPSETKSIELWYDKMNHAFHSFAYFYYVNENRTYILTVCFYDTLGHIIGKSPVFEFPNSAGNIEFVESISHCNEKPSIYIYADILKQRGDSISYGVRAYGKIDNNSKCEIDIGATGTFSQLTLTRITRIDTLKNMDIGGILRIDTSTYSIGTIQTTVPNDTGLFQIKAKVIDNYGNIATSSLDVHVADLKEELSLYTTTPLRMANYTDTLRIHLSSNYPTSVKQVSIKTDSTWRTIDSTNVKTTDSLGGKVVIIRVPFTVPADSGDYMVYAKVESKFSLLTDSISLISWSSSHQTPSVDSTITVTRIEYAKYKVAVDMNLNLKTLEYQLNNAGWQTVSYMTATISGIQLSSANPDDLMNATVTFRVTTQSNQVYTKTVPVD